MTIREKAAKAIAWRELTDKDRKKCIWPDDYSDSELKEYRGIAATAIGVFLEAAAEEGWHMRPDEATGEMARRAFCFGKGKNAYRAMLAAAPEFDWGK